jgi:hypothetical protein
MQLLCIGDVAPADVCLPEQPWDLPGGILPGPDRRILFNWELPMGSGVNQQPRTSGPRLVVKPESLKLIEKWAPGIATLATNHILDGEESGLRQTMESLCGAGFATVGAGMTAEEITRPLFWKTTEGTLAILNWVFAETHPDWNAVPGPNCWPGTEEAARLIQTCKSQADWVLVVVHWSDEDYSYPLPGDRETARALAQAGADVIIGHHPHVVRGSETIGSCPVFYSLGNFYFADITDASGGYVVQMSPRNQEGLGVLVDFQRGRKPECSPLSFYQVGSQWMQDPANRATRRMQSTSAVLRKFQGEAYRQWHARDLAMFLKVGYPWHFGVRKIGLRGIFPYLLRKVRGI